MGLCKATTTTAIMELGRSALGGVAYSVLCEPALKWYRLRVRSVSGRLALGIKSAEALE